MSRLLRALLLLLLGGCALDGMPDQALHLDAHPADAVCAAFRAGEKLGELAAGRPLEVPLSRAPIHLSCSANGYEPARYVLTSVGPRSGVAGIAAFGFDMLDVPGERFLRYADPVVVRLQPSTIPPRTAFR
jgi:hypothetical protein